jgi:type IV pilus assembly protein PilX
MVLVTALLLLIVVTLLAVGMFRSFGIDERIAGNVREKQRALAAAQTAEQQAEFWLTSGANATTGVSCTTTQTLATATVCSNLLTTPTNVPWNNLGVTYKPANMTVTSTPAAGTYYYSPSFYVAYLGPTPNGLGKVYQIDAAGFGTAPDSVAVVESTFAVQTSVSCLGGCGQ